MLNYFKQIWNNKTIRNSILFTLGILIVYRFIAQVTIPGANVEAVRAVFQQNQLLGQLSLFTGGSAENFSIILMGLSPYITASIIVQLLTVIVPKLESISKEGMDGRRKLNQYTRWLTIPLAFIQSYGMIFYVNSQAPIPIFENISDPFVIIPIMITVTAGSVLLMWLGELISEFGISNGISILIFAGIVASFPAIISQNIALAQQSQEYLIPFVLMILITLILLVLVTFVTEGERRIPILYATRGARGGAQKSNLPIRVNQAGMVPIIFALSVVSFPTIIAQFAQTSNNETVSSISDFIIRNLNQNTIWYALLFFFLVLGFTFFYVSIQFNPEQVAENIQKRGGYIPGVRPGKETANHLGKVSNRLNLFGGLFIGFLAITPNLLQILSNSLAISAIPVLIGGASMIIIVNVILEIIRQINAQLIMSDYQNL